MKCDKILEYYNNFIFYKVYVTYKHIRNIIYRYDKEEDIFIVSAPYFTSDNKVIKYLVKFAPKLIAKAGNKQSPLKNNSVYVFGHILPIEIGTSNRFLNDRIVIKQKSELNNLLSKVLLRYLNERVPYYEELMNVKKYRVSVRNMHTRHASNSRSKRHLTFAISLVHYNFPIIDSVIIHELAHDTHFDHSKEFYNLVNKYCPNYKQYKKALDTTRYDYEVN